jgi:hypothetical protein
MRVRHATQAAPGRADNEDGLVLAGNLVGVLDGVTVPDGMDVGCIHSVAWYVDRLAARLAMYSAAVPRYPLVDILASSIAAVREDHGPECDLTHPGTHAATIALLRDHSDHVEYLVLCDARLVLDRGDTVEVISDGRFAEVIAEARRNAFNDMSAIDSDDHTERVLRAVHIRHQLVNREGGYWIAAANPDAAKHAVTGSAVGVRRAALLTDGAADAVERYGALDWPGLLTLAETSEPEEVIRVVRKAEDADPEGQDTPRFKRHDDATIALCTFERTPE